MPSSTCAPRTASCDERAPAHAASGDYAFHRFATNPSYLGEVAAFDRLELGPIAGLHGVHLQRHIGTDTVSLARLGARMSGLDFSAASLVEARRLALLAGAHVDFHEADVYVADQVLGRGVFDFVYTGVGALCWLPGVRRWAELVAALLRPGGMLLHEHDSVPWEALPGQMDRTAAGEWRLCDRPRRLSLTHTLKAVKRAVR